MHRNGFLDFMGALPDKSFDFTFCDPPYDAGKPLVKCKNPWDDARLGEEYSFREERFDHPGRTALALVKKVLYRFDSPGDIALDLFFGATLRMGCEINSQYLAVVCARVARLERQPLPSAPLDAGWNQTEANL